MLLTASAAWMLIMISGDLRASGLRADPVSAYGLPVVLAAATIMVAVTVGPLVFSAVVFVPAAVSQLMQLRSLISSPDVSAVSSVFLAMGVISQVLWCSWGVLAQDLCNELVAGSLIILSGANLTCYLLRRFDLLRLRRPMPGLAAAELAIVPVRVKE